MRTPKSKSLTRRITLVETTLDGVIDSSKREFDLVHGRLNRIEGELVSQGNALTRVIQKLEAEFAAIHSRFDRMEEKFDLRFLSIERKIGIA